MDIEAKKQEVISALRSGEVTQRDIDNSDCRTTSKVLRGEMVGDRAVDRLYGRLEDIRRRGGVAKDRVKATGGKESAKVKAEKQGRVIAPSLPYQETKPATRVLDSVLGNSLDNQRGQIEGLIAKNRELESQVSSLTERLKEVEGQVSHLLPNRLSNALPNELPKHFDNSHCLGFQLVQKSVKGQVYWYGVKAVGRKTAWVYVGKEKDLVIAERKIRAYCEAKGIALEA